MSVLQIILIILAIIICFFILIMAIDTHRLVVRKYAVSLSNLKKDVRIVLLSDLHSKSFGPQNSKLIARIDEINPDMILVAGDMYTALKHDVATQGRLLLKNLSSRYPIYYGNGNHEHKTSLLPDEFDIDYRSYVSEIKDMGIIHLDNESIFLDEYGIKIYGLTLPFKYYRKMSRKRPEVDEIRELIGNPEENVVNVLIAHNPQYFDEYAEWGADLTVSGHVHGGLVRLGPLGGVLSPNYTFFPKYSGGKYQLNDKESVMVLSCGLGTHHIPLRIFNPGEISCIELRR